MNQQGAHRYEDRLLEFAYGELPAAEARSIESHVKGCARCTGALREIEGVRHQMSQLAPEPAPDAGLESLLAYAEQAARRAQAGPAPARGLRRWLFGAVGAASLAAVLVTVGLVSTRKDLQAPTPATMQKDEARQQVQAEQAATPPPAAATAAPAAEAPPVSQEKNEAAGEDKAVAQVAGQENDGRNLDSAPSADPDESGRAEQPEPKVGKPVGKEYVQQVEVSSKNEAKYRPKEHDSLDQMSNMVPGRGTRPALPTAGAQYAQKTAPGPAPADGEFGFPKDTPRDAKVAFKPAPANKKSAPSPAPAKRKLARMEEGSGGGFGDLSSAIGASNGGGRVLGGASTAETGKKDKGVSKSADDGFDSLFGTGKASGPSGLKQSGSAGVVRPSSPPSQVARAPVSGNEAPLNAGAAREDPLLAKQRAEMEAALRARAESTRRQAEAQKAERAKLARDDENAAVFDETKKSVAMREPPPPQAAPAPSRSRSVDGLALRSPPPQAQAPVPQADEPAEEMVAQAQTAPVERSAPSSTRKAAEAPPPQAPARARSQEAQELYAQARPGSREEIEVLMRALPGLTGKTRIDALQRLCTRLEDQRDDRAYGYCSAWASADPGSAVARKRANEAELRISSRKAKAAKQAAPAAADSLEAPAKAEPAAPAY